MIIVQLLGGIGNQMFQYAMARRLAYKRNVELKLDISIYKSYPQKCTIRTYDLACFNIQEKFATRMEIEKLDMSQSRGINRIKYKILKLVNKGKINRTVLKEENNYFNPDVLNAGNNLYIKGYWQSEKYFADIKGIIQSDFTIKYTLEGKNKESAKIIDDTTSVSLHIRRGDYISDRKTNQFHGICSLDYYKTGINILIDKFGKLNLFVFSDDIDWVKENLKTDLPTAYIDHNTHGKHYEDMRLMSLCKHNIIANSSFSWWGAWLNRNPDKVVIAPIKWFNNLSANSNDIIPENWVRI